MKFAVVVYESPELLAQRNNPDTAPAYWAAYGAYSKALQEAGVAAGGAGLQGPDTAVAVRLAAGKRAVQDGPYIESKEILGGFFVIDVPDIETALKWAAKCPSLSGGGVEVRPLLPPPPGVK